MWEGRVSEPQRHIQKGTATTLIAGEGFGAQLKDNNGSMVFIDRDLTRWGSWSATRQRNLAASYGTDAISWSVVPDSVTGLPSISATFEGGTVNLPLAEVWYDAGPQNQIGRMRFGKTTMINLGAYPTDGHNLVEVTLHSGDDASGEIGGGQILSQSPFSYDITPTGQERYATIQFYYSTSGSAGSTGATYGWQISNISIIGDHGLTLQLPAGGTAYVDDGFEAADIARYAVLMAMAQGAKIQLGQIDPTGYTVTHYVQYTPVAFEQMVSDMAQLSGGCHYGVWESNSPLFDDTPAFVFLQPRDEATIFTSLADCDEIDLSERLSALYNTATVTWQTPDGSTGATTVTLPNGILDLNGIGRTITYDLGTSTDAAAATFATFALQALFGQQRGAGSVTLPKSIRTGGGAYRGAHTLKAGIDRLQINDIPFRTGLIAGNPDANAFRISRVEVSVQDGTPGTRVELDTGPNLIETLQARLQLATHIAGG